MKQLRNGDYVDKALVDFEECISVLSTLRNEFSRFTDVRVRSNLQELKLVSTPFDFPYDDAPTDVQMELVELQASDVLSSKFSSCTTLIDFYPQLPLSLNASSVDPDVVSILKTYTCLCRIF